MSFATWLLFLITETALALTPGPAVLFVVGTALRQGFNAGMRASLGILSGNTLYFLAAATGLGVLVERARPVFVAVKWLGAGYLLWLALSAWRAARAPTAAELTDASVTKVVAAPYRAALLLQLANPKAILFFTALLPQFVRADAAWPVALQVGALGVTSVVSEFGVLLGYVALAASVARAGHDPRLLRNFERASAACLTACAALVLAS